MKELSIHICENDLNGFVYSLKRNSLLLYKRRAKEGDSLYSVIQEAATQSAEPCTVKVIWNNRASILIPSQIFNIEELYNYIGIISTVIRDPQCIQCGEFVAVWNTDNRMEEFWNISEQLGLTITHTHQRVEHIIKTPDNGLYVSLIDNLLYISEKKADGHLKNSIVAEAYRFEDFLYYLSVTAQPGQVVYCNIPEDWAKMVAKSYRMIKIRQ